VVKSLGEHYIEVRKRFMDFLTPEEKEIVNEFTKLNEQWTDSSKDTEESKIIDKKCMQMFKKHTVLQRKIELRWK
jgi:hypothetical protein